MQDEKQCDVRSNFVVFFPAVLKNRYSSAEVIGTAREFNNIATLLKVRKTQCS